MIENDVFYAGCITNPENKVHIIETLIVTQKATVTDGINKN